MVVIIDYGMGNVNSIRNMLKKVGVSSQITADLQRIEEASRYILPGVGAFDVGVEHLEQSGILEPLKKQVLEQKKPILGICLGMQLLTHGSEEGEKEGLGWIDARCRRFAFDDAKASLPVPHMGWNHVHPLPNHPIFEGLEESRFYFVHSYYAPEESPHSVATARYGFDFSCAVQNKNVYGVQFHPEKSHRFGKQLLKNFCEI